MRFCHKRLCRAKALSPERLLGQNKGGDDMTEEEKKKGNSNTPSSPRGYSHQSTANADSF